MNSDLYNHVLNIKDNIHIKKSKKSVFTLQEDNITFKVKICRIPSCPFCPKVIASNIMKCRHVLYILIYHYNLSVFYLSHLWNDTIYSVFEQNKKSVNLDEILQKEIKKYISESECAICLENIDGKIYQCTKCSKIVHSKCMNVWFDKSKDNGKRGKCIYCIQ